MMFQYILVCVPVFLLLLDVSITLNVIPICLTWITNGSYLIFECTLQVAGFTDDILLVDPFGNNRLKCSLEESPSCLGSHNYVLHNDVAENITTLEFKTAKKNQEGEWKCLHRSKEAYSYVSYKKGSTSTKDVKISGEIWKTGDRNGFKLACFSCWKPYFDRVDFYVNGVLEDSIRYYDGSCYHKRQLCKPDTCTCLSNGKSVTWNFMSDLSYVQFTCEMRFKDKLTSTISVHKTELTYNESGFIESQKSIASFDYADKYPDYVNENTEKTDNLGYIGYIVYGTLCLFIGIILVTCWWQLSNQEQELDNNSTN